MKFFWIFLMLLSFSPLVFAANAAPLGLELGVATYTQVKQQVGGKTSLSDEGINKYSGGKMLQGNGDGLGIDGLSEITFIFDVSDKLAAVLMTLPKDSFAKTLSALSGKYKLLEKQVPFVGNASAKLQQGESVIELNAPHMSFAMSVHYLTKSLKQVFTQQASREFTAQEKQQADKF
ncbi:MAG: hypothetical protein PXX73_02785 [Sideroxydans sp.]|nr:hypothetical protein [Sideroxydans sp.]